MRGPPPPNVRPIDGSATLTMNRSRFTIAMPAVTTANTAAKRAVPLVLTVVLPWLCWCRPPSRVLL